MKDKILGFGVIAVAGSLWDVWTSAKGVYVYTDATPFVAIAVTFFMNGILLVSCKQFDDENMQIGLFVLVIVALLGDLYTAYKGNRALLGESEDFAVEFLAGIMTVATVGCTLLTSYLYYRYNKKAE